MLRSDIYGLRTLAGGTDGYTVTQNARQPNPTIILVQARLAELAAHYAVDQEIQMPMEDRHLFPHVEFSMTPTENPTDTQRQLQYLHLLVFGKSIQPDGPEIKANIDLWNRLYTIDNNTKSAWTGLLIALLRDPDFLLY